jgi:integrase
MALTTATARSLRAPGKYLDGHGLVLHVVSERKRYWVFRYQRDGRERSMALGNADVLSLAEVRKLHTEARAALARGVDPLAEREEAQRALKAERAAAVSFGEAADRYIADHRAGWRPRGELHWRQSLAVHVLPALGAKPVGQVGVEDVLRVLSPIWSTKTTMAVILRSRIELVLDYARAHGWRSGENPAVWRGNLRSLLPPPAKVHRVTHRPALPWQEAPAFLARLHAAPLMTGRCLTFLILTATRSGEARGALWSEIDLDAAVWTIPAERMKAGKEHRVPLSEPALALLRGIAPLRTDEPLVFLGAKAGRSLTDVALNKTPRRLGHDGITVHGFRSTFRDWCADHGKPAELAEAALAHVTGSAVERAYARSDLLGRRRALMAEWADFLTRQPAEVVPLRAPRAFAG